jgi:hypothetical protein
MVMANGLSSCVDELNTAAAGPMGCGGRPDGPVGDRAAARLPGAVVVGF